VVGVLLLAPMWYSVWILAALRRLGVPIIWVTVLVELMATGPVAYLYGAWFF
jgi:hypothetical protein